MHISDVNRNTRAELESALPSGEEDTSETLRQPPAVGLISRQQDTYFIPPLLVAREGDQSQWVRLRWGWSIDKTQR